MVKIRQSAFTYNRHNSSSLLGVALLLAEEESCGVRESVETQTELTRVRASCSDAGVVGL